MGASGVVRRFPRYAVTGFSRALITAAAVYLLKLSLIKTFRDGPQSRGQAAKKLAPSDTPVKSAAER